MSSYIEQTVDIAWHAVEGNGQGLWYSWAIDDCLIGTDAFNLTSYDIYRRTGGTGIFTQINLAPNYDTTYLDADLSPQEYHYFVMALSPGCTQPVPSDTISLDVITSMEQTIENHEIKVYPNPASEIVYISNSTMINEIEVMNLLGRNVFTLQDVHSPATKINLSNLPPGVFVMKISTSDGVHTVKVIITR